jgi:hypothetical protein
MVRKTVAISVDKDVYTQYQGYCHKYHYVLSRKLEEFMRKELGKEVNNAKSRNH